VRDTGAWITEREIGAQVRALFPERATTAKKLGTTEVVASRPTRDAPAERGLTIDLPLPVKPPAASPSRSRLPLAIGAVALIAVAATIGYLARGPSTSATAATPGSAIDAARPPGGEDAHWLVPEDYFVSRDPLSATNPYLQVYVAKQVAADGHGSASFVTSTGDDIGTTVFWKSRIARPEDLVVGRLAFCFEFRSHPAAECHPPATKRDARTAMWMIGKIADTADVAKGTVTVARCVCDVAATRVPL
jgi:hypothetical protein